MTQRNLSVLLLSITLTVFAACTGQKTNGTAKPSITGNWLLTETLNDPGDGSGKWKPVAKVPAQTIRFGADGTVSGNAVPELMNYKFADSTHISFVIRNNATPVKYRYKLTTNSLEINAPCREACGLKFVRLSR